MIVLSRLAIRDRLSPVKKLVLWRSLDHRDLTMSQIDAIHRIKRRILFLTLRCSKSKAKRKQWQDVLSCGIDGFDAEYFERQEEGELVTIMSCCS